ncbi:AN1-type zinc finger protein 2A-like [Schistocerca gregaria]|uniref:AN1-type zinc finger protein 2A-like n=1 Tax=Schistocerca gregaria TaxID=7010 RepID=UPI00211F1842|nr:AN1-type zinc finger protein 2A-like [Schistocerca gregaria]
MLTECTYLDVGCAAVRYLFVACITLVMEFPHLGEQCSELSCKQLDYLPLKCDACEKIFCKDHVSYNSHSCPSAYKKDVQVPVCPLCNVPIPVKRGEPPDIAVGAHIDSDCQSHTAKTSRKVFANRCSAKGCKQKEVVRVQCAECRLNFCLRHRHPVDHNCEGAEAARRRRAVEAALARQNGPGYNKNVSNSTNTQTATAAQLQGGLSEDEALARAIALSLEDSDGRRQPNRQHTVQPAKCAVS